MAEARRAMAEARRAWRTERLRLREELLRMSRDLEEARSATAAAEARASAAGKEAAPAEARDEISRFQDARYVTATWRAKLAKSEIYPKLRAKLAKSEIYPKLLKRLFAQDLKPRRQKTDLWGLLFSAKSSALVLACVIISSLLGALLCCLIRDNFAEAEDDVMPELDTTDSEDNDEDMPFLEMPWPLTGVPPDALWVYTSTAAAC